MPKLDKNAEALLRDPNTQTVLYELTPERKEKLVKLSDEIMDLLRKRTDGPGEAMVLLHLMQETLVETMGNPVIGKVTIEGIEN